MLKLFLICLPFWDTVVLAPISQEPSLFLPSLQCHMNGILRKTPHFLTKIRVQSEGLLRSDQGTAFYKGTRY